MCRFLCQVYCRHIYCTIPDDEPDGQATWRLDVDALPILVSVGKVGGSSSSGPIFDPTAQESACLRSTLVLAVSGTDVCVFHAGYINRKLMVFVLRIQ